MTDVSKFRAPSKSDVDRISRRNFLKRAVGGAALAGTTALPAWGGTGGMPYGGASRRARTKISKAAARYQYHPNRGQQCGRCVHFRGPAHAKSWRADLSSGLVSVFQGSRPRQRAARRAWRCIARRRVRWILRKF
jgi:hypothetical protein